MEKRNGFSLRTSIRAWWYLAALGCLSLSAHAQSDFGDKIWWKADAGQWVPGYNRSAAFQGVKATPYTGSGALVVNGAGVVLGPSEWPKARATSPIPGLNKSAAIDVQARFNPTSSAQAIGRFLGKVGPLANAVALVTLASELGFTLSNEDGGPVEVSQPNPLYCTANCRTYTASGYPSSESPYYQTTCDKVIAYLNANSNSNGQYTYSLHSATVNQCNTYRNGTTIQSHTVSSVARAPDSPTASVKPGTIQELEDAIASQSGWPSSSAIGPAIVATLRSGETIQTDAPVVSGPSSSPVSTTTTQNPNGSTTTATTTNNYTYNGPSVKVTTTTITQTLNPSTGITETTTQTMQEEPVTTPVEEEDQNQCKLTPDALGCAELDTPDGVIPRDTKTISYAEENVFGSGSCPSNLTASIATLGSSVTVWDWSKTCELALPLRALVVGLASFAALLIVMPGGNKP